MKKIEILEKLLIEINLSTNEDIFEDIKWNVIDVLNEFISANRQQEELCDCEIPKPKSPFIGDYDYDYCRDCNRYISQTNYL